MCRNSGNKPGTSGDSAGNASAAMKGILSWRANVCATSSSDTTPSWISTCPSRLPSSCCAESARSRSRADSLPALTSISPSRSRSGAGCDEGFAKEGSVSVMRITGSLGVAFRHRAFTGATKSGECQQPGRARVYPRRLLQCGMQPQSTDWRPRSTQGKSVAATSFCYYFYSYLRFYIKPYPLIWA